MWHIRNVHGKSTVESASWGHAQLAGSEWKLVEEGKRGDAPDQAEPRFSTWEEVTGRKQQQQQQQQQQQRAQSGAQASTSAASPQAPDLTYYR